MGRRVGAIDLTPPQPPTPSHAVCTFVSNFQKDPRGYRPGGSFPAITAWPPPSEHVDELGHWSLTVVHHAGSFESARACFAELIGMDRPIAYPVEVGS